MEPITDKIKCECALCDYDAATNSQRVDLIYNTFIGHIRKKHGITKKQYYAMGHVIPSDVVKANSERCAKLNYDKYRAPEYVSIANAKLLSKVGIDIYNTYPVCQICGLVAKQLFQHLGKVHKISTTEYKKDFPNSPLALDEYFDYLSKSRTGENNPMFNNGTPENSPYAKEFYLKKGYSEDVAIEMANAKIKKTKADMGDDKFSTKPEFYMSKYNVDYATALNMLTERQSTNRVDKIAERNGITLAEAQVIRDDITGKWIHTMNSKSDDEIVEINRKKANMVSVSKISLDFIDALLIHTGIPKEETLYGDNEKGFACSNNNGRFKRTSVRFDFCYKKKLIEFNGDIFHANPLIYSATDQPLLGTIGTDARCELTAQEMWDADERKAQVARDNGYEVFVVWESEWKTNKADALNSTKGFLFDSPEPPMKPVPLSISDEVRRKFIESYSCDGIEVMTDTGWQPLSKIHKTVEYDRWELTTERHTLACADTHIVFASNSYRVSEVYVKDLKPGDVIMCDDGTDIVTSVTSKPQKEHMYDLELADTNHRFYSNGILSHNSTTTRAFLLWQGIFQRDISIAILANNLALAMEQLEALKDSYAMLPQWMQPGVLEWNKKRIRFSHGTRILCAPTSTNGIRGMAINILYIDEFAFIPSHIAEPFIASIFPTIASGKSTKIFITSTPFGVNHFYDLWQKAMKGPGNDDWNEFVPKEIAWNAVPGRDEEWARKQIRQIGELKFLQEFKCQFIGSVSTLIDHTFLSKLVPTKSLAIPRLPEFVRIYELPRPQALLDQKGWEYVACLDSGFGVRQDSSVLKIYLVKKSTNIHLVAQMSANDMEIADFCKHGRKLLAKYYDPRLIIEMNGPGSAAMDQFHSVYEYENLLHFDPKGRMRGLYAGVKLRDSAVILLKAYVQRKLIKDYDQDTISELYSFGKVSKDKWGAMGGNHDDHVMAMMWVIYYVNSPLYYGEKDEDVAMMDPDEIILDTPENREIEMNAIRNMKDRDFHNKELTEAAEHNPYDQEDGTYPEEKVENEDYAPAMAMRS